MKRLVRLLLVNWYRLEQQSIEIEGHTAVIGPNASGKSSLLDAVQAVLVGGHKDWWKPNASAGEKSTRSLRDYCLGVVRDPETKDLSAEFQPRQQAISYLVLVFRDDDGEATSVGLCMHARLEESREQIDGRFIAPGVDLHLAELTDQLLSGDSAPKPWARLREELRQRGGTRLVIEGTPEKFQEQICALLSDGRRHLDRKRFLRAFRNAITFTPIKNVSEFVRKQILEVRDIQVKSLQLALRNYGEISRKTQEAKRREESLVAIDGQFRKAEQAERSWLSWRWVEQEARFNALEEELEPLREAIEQRAQALQTLTGRIEVLDADWRKADEQLQAATAELARTDVEQKRRTLAAERRAAEQQLAGIRRELDQARHGLGQVHALLDHAELLAAPELVAALNGLSRQLGGDDLLPDTWPLDAGAIAGTIAAIQPHLTATLAYQRDLRDQALMQIGTLEVQLTELRTRIQRMEESGGSDLSPATRQLIALLQEQGIRAVPLCDRVELAEEDWRDALEAFLGGHREALLVAPEQVREAIRLYRQAGRRLGLFGSRIVNTLKSDEWLRRSQPGSLAEVIQSDDPHAIAYLNRRAGNVIRVASEDELTRFERAITADGMLASGGAITRLKPLDPMLGRAAREQTLAKLKRQFQDDSLTYSQAKDRKEQLERLLNERLAPFDNQLQHLPDWRQAVNQRQQRLSEIRELNEQEQALADDGAYQRLKQQKAEAETHRAEIDLERKQSRERQENLKEKQARETDQLASKSDSSEEVARQRGQIESIPGFDAEQASGHLDDLQQQVLLAEQGADFWLALAERADKSASKQATARRNRLAEAHDGLKDYLAQWPNQQPPSLGLDEDPLPQSAWVLAQLDAVRDTELARYATEADSALREAETAFRADFVGKLQENLHLLESQRRELNQNLKRRPFHGQYYHFVKQPDRALEPILRWVESWTPEQGSDVGGLFDGSHDPNHPHHEAIARIKGLLMAAAEDAPSGDGLDADLADYRQYYHFDVKMTDDQDGQRNAELLSRRLGKGSGGEHQSPFYVAIGAALAAAYRIERDDQGGYRGGLGLAVFDEAFSKLDLQNTVSALGFLDELGLQVLLAAPDEKYGQIAEHVDTIINVYRDGGEVYIDTDYIKPAARQALSADNPAHRPGPDNP